MFSQEAQRVDANIKLLVKRMEKIEEQLPIIDNQLSEHQQTMLDINNKISDMDEIFDRTRARTTRNENDIADIMNTLKDIQKKI